LPTDNLNVLLTHSVFHLEKTTFIKIDFLNHNLFSNMPTTPFKPSIHGWPFVNSFDYSFLFNKVTIGMGFCGGMCWDALDKFYSNTRIDRALKHPVQGEQLYNELFKVQEDSLPIETLAKIYDWQQSPDIDHAFDPLHGNLNIYHSLGFKSKNEWQSIQSALDSHKPVTLTLIASSNDFNLLNMSNNHRVVVYGYTTRGLNDNDKIQGTKNPNIQRVDMMIYDPNYPNDDHVTLSFYVDCDDNWIGLTHNRGDNFHGFFMDEKKR
jgi:hypothetical protein